MDKECTDKVKEAVETEIDQEYLDPVQQQQFIAVLKWYMGIAQEGKKSDMQQGEEADCLTAVLKKNCLTVALNKEEKTLTAYWIKGNALGSLTVCKPDASSSARLPITGRFRSLSTLRELELHDIRLDGPQSKPELRLSVILHWRDGTDSFDRSTIGATDQSAYDRAVNFIARLQEVIAHDK
jgi:hypothetical protein